MKKELDSNTLESSELVEQIFEFWFKGKDHIRSPFPEYIRPELKRLSVQRFFTWASMLKEEVKKEINDTMIGEKFEEIIFETALDLVQTEDEKLTIRYPFMPRTGDSLDNKEIPGEEASIVRDRSIVKEGDSIFLKVMLEYPPDKKTWETRFELPA